MYHYYYYNEEALLQKQNCVQEAKNAFEKFLKHYYFEGANFVSLTYVASGVQTRKHLKNTEETLTLKVSQMFPRLPRMLKT